jgi:LCP family protein required for cell wall assembly
VRALAAVLSTVVLLGSGYGWASYRHFTSGLTQVDGIPGGSGADADGAALNVLLVGDDHRPADATPEELAQLSTQQDGGAVNTDTMMVLHLPAGSGRPTVISFPRDSWVDIPGHGKGKLNSAFALGAAGAGGDAGGMKLLVQTLQQLTGLTIDHFVRVSLLGFYDIAQVLGPIQVCLNEPAKDPLSGTDLPAGVSTLDAKQALSFVRQRHGLPRGDLDREVRQQYFLSQELHKVLSAGTLLDPVKTQRLLSAVSSSLQTDPTLDLLGLANRFSSLSADAVDFATVPVAGTPTITGPDGNPVSIVQLDTAALPAFINGVLGTPGTTTGGRASAPASPAATPVDPSTVSVQVVNATGRSGLAASNAAALREVGFTVAGTSNAAAASTTTITYPARLQAQARTLAAHVPGAQLRASASAAAVTLTLGTDGVQVASASGSAGTAAPASSSAASSAASPSAAPQAFAEGACIN